MDKRPIPCAGCGMEVLSEGDLLEGFCETCWESIDESTDDLYEDIE